MSSTSQAKNQYDVLVVGAGPGGLSAATALARKGFKVLLVEKNSVAGGNCTSFQKEGYRFDLALHQLSGVDTDGGFACGILKEYGIRDRIQFCRVEPFMTIVMPDREYNLSGDWNQFQSDLGEYFPESKEEIRRLFAKIRHDYEDTFLLQRMLFGDNQVVREILENISLKKKLTLPVRLPGVFLGLNQTGERYLKKYVSNSKLWAVLTSSWPYLGLPPEEISGFFLAQFIATQHREQTFYPIGSSQILADQFVSAFQLHGGELRLGDPVKTILVENNRATGIETKSGDRFFGKMVISNADLTHTLTSLVGEKHVRPKLSERLKSLRPSVGPFRVFLGLDFEIHKHGLPNYEYIFYRGYDHEKTYELMKHGFPALVSAYSPTRFEPANAPKGHSTLILLTMFPWETNQRDWRTHKEEIVEEMIGVVEKRAPDIRQHIRVRELLTPEGLNARTNTFNGAMYGWDCGPDQSVIKRFPQTTSIKNLFFAGHWTQPGPGVTTAIVSGWLTADLVRKKLERSPN